MEKSIIFITILLMGYPIYSQADGKELSSAEKEAALIELFDQAEKSALEQAQSSRDLETEQPGSPPSSPTPTVEEQTVSPDELIFRLAAKVDELREKSLVTTATTLATQKASLAKPIGSQTVYSFKEGDIYEIRASLDRVTDIALQPGESLTNIPVSGDTVRWKIGIITSGQSKDERTHIILKPLDRDIETNIVLSTDRRVYHLRAIASDWYMPTVSWHYPADQEAELQQAISRKKRVEPIKVTPDELNFAYDISSNDEISWSPLRVFDDGEKTYLQMPKKMKVTEAPALFIIEDNKPMLVNYRVKGDFYIVDRLFKEALLRAGTTAKVEIVDRRYRKSFFQRLF